MVTSLSFIITRVAINHVKLELRIETLSFTADEILDGSIDDVVKRLKQVDSTFPDEIIVRVTSLISDQDRAEVVRAEAAMALGRCSTHDCRATLKSLLAHEVPTLRRLAVTGLGADNADESIQWLIQMLADPVNKVRNDAERSLMKREKQYAQVGIEALLVMLTHPVALTRSPAARLLGLSQDDRALQPLLEMLNSEEWLERMWAAKSLGDLGKDEAVLALKDKVKLDKKNRVRAAAADALGTLKPEGIEELLKEIAENDEDEGVRKSAHEAVLALGFDAEDAEFDPFAE